MISGLALEVSKISQCVVWWASESPLDRLILHKRSYWFLPASHFLYLLELSFRFLQPLLRDRTHTRWIHRALHVGLSHGSFSCYILLLLINIHLLLPLLNNLLTTRPLIILMTHPELLRCRSFLILEHLHAHFNSWLIFSILANILLNLHLLQAIQLSKVIVLDSLLHGVALTSELVLNSFALLKS